MVVSVNPVVVQPQSQPRNLPVPMSHYRPHTLREGLLEDILERETGVSNKFPGIDVQEGIAHCYEQMTPAEQEIVKETVGEENIPKSKPRPKAETPKGTAKSVTEAAEQAVGEAAKAGKEATRGKWGWIIGIGAVLAGLGGGYKIYSDNKQKQLNLSA